MKFSEGEKMSACCSENCRHICVFIMGNCAKLLGQGPQRTAVTFHSRKTHRFNTNLDMEMMLRKAPVFVQQ